ncbi:hypothetical protein BDZ97DRAFT_1654368, partial [Flammula alnicola]
KLDVRNRKREALPAGSEWKQPKYDAAYEYQQMSDDEDAYGEDGNLLPDVYTSCAPGSRSEIVTQMFKEIDQQKDPRPSGQFIKRVQGEVKEEQGPPATKTLKGRARRWMVDSTWLLNHPDFDTERVVADNGKLWGDETNPEELEERSAHVAAEKKRRASGVSGGGESSKKKKAKKGQGKKKPTQQAPSNDNNSDINN